MFVVDQMVLIVGLLMGLAIILSKLSARIGMPVLVVFIGLGMLAGSDGIGGIDFDDFGLAHAIGTVALALILFDGGLQTPTENLRMTWKPSIVLATVGVIFTSLLTGLAAMYFLDFNVYEGLLIGSIVGSTDAAAVFALLRSAGIRLRKRISSTLEIESGANDPMAIFLTVGLIEIVTGEAEPGLGLLVLFVKQMGIGLAIGLLMGRLSARLINRINLPAAGLYSVLTTACGLSAFGIAAALGGSGFLAAYVAGIILGNSKIVFHRATLLFHDGMAWIGQVAMFVVLGLFATPSSLSEVWGESLLIAAILAFVARPVTVFLLAWPFGFSFKELLLISWVGLKGAVPIILATYPMMAGLPVGPTIFNVVFFVVLISALVQGGLLPPIARYLGLEDPTPERPPVELEIVSLGDVNAEIIEYYVHEDSPACGRTLRQIPLPEGAVVAMILRDGGLIPPRGSTGVQDGDHLYLVVSHEVRPHMDVLFGRHRGDGEIPQLEKFKVRADARLEELDSLYGVRLQGKPEDMLKELVRAQEQSAGVGSRLVQDDVVLEVVEMIGDRICTISIEVLPPEDESDEVAPAE